MKLNNFDFSDFLNILVIAAPILFFAVILLIGYGRVITTQQALNQECKTNYNLLQVALAGDNLSRICQMKNQTLNIK